MKKQHKRFGWRRVAVAAAALLLVCVTVSPAGSIIQRALQGEDLASVIAGRSPGQRQAGNLIKVKGGKLGVAAAPLRQRVLSLLRTRPTPAPLEEQALPGAPFPIEAPVGSDGVVFGSGPIIGDGVPFVPSIGGGVGGPFLPPGNPGLFPSGPTPSPTPTPNPTPTPIVTGPIPEPATWLMMIFGLGVVGAALRRRRADAGRAATLSAS